MSCRDGAAVASFASHAALISYKDGVAVARFIGDPCRIYILQGWCGRRNNRDPCRTYIRQGWCGRRMIHSRPMSRRYPEKDGAAVVAWNSDSCHTGILEGWCGRHSSSVLRQRLQGVCVCVWVCVCVCVCVCGVGCRFLGQVTLQGTSCLSHSVCKQAVWLPGVSASFVGGWG